MKALFLVAFFSFLRKSNLLYCVRDGLSMYLRRSYVVFAKDGEADVEGDGEGDGEYWKSMVNIAPKPFYSRT